MPETTNTTVNKSWCAQQQWCGGTATTEILCTRALGYYCNSSRLLLVVVDLPRDAPKVRYEMVTEGGEYNHVSVQFWQYKLQMHVFEISTEVDVFEKFEEKWELQLIMPAIYLPKYVSL